MVTDCKGQKQNISGNSLQMLFNLQKEINMLFPDFFCPAFFTAGFGLTSPCAFHLLIIYIRHQTSKAYNSSESFQIFLLYKRYKKISGKMCNSTVFYSTFIIILLYYQATVKKYDIKTRKFQRAMDSYLFWMSQQAQSFLQRGIVIFFFIGQILCFSLLKIKFCNSPATLVMFMFREPILGRTVILAEGSPTKLIQLLPISLWMKQSLIMAQNSSIQSSNSTGMLVTKLILVDILMSTFPRKDTLKSMMNSPSSDLSSLAQIIYGGCPEASKSQTTISEKYSLIYSLREMYISLEIVQRKSWLFDHSVQATKPKRLMSMRYSQQKRKPVSKLLTFSRPSQRVYPGCSWLVRSISFMSSISD